MTKSKKALVLSVIGDLLIAAAGYCLGDLMCERRITRGMKKIFSSNKELESAMFEQVNKYIEENK